jgi:hypothetical protein
MKTCVMKNSLLVRSTSFVSLLMLCCSLAVRAQEVVNDDLIVIGRECVGVDCIATGEGGLDIIKMKHNNTKLLFDDTSTSAGFPATDWRLTANDSFVNGVNRFSIEDATAATVPFTIRGAAPSNSLFVSNLGRVGVGTSTPDSRLDVEASTSVDLRLTATGGSAWRLINDSAGFAVEQVGAAFRAVQVDSAGNMDINGMLNQGSSRSIKTDIVAADPRATLRAVAALPLLHWRYKADAGVRHVGPMAEDFYRAFGLGSDDKHIAAGDQAGVALLAIQGLDQVVAEKDRRIGDLEGRVAALEGLIREMAAKAPGTQP